MVRSPLRTSLLPVKYSDSVMAIGLFQLVRKYLRFVFFCKVEQKSNNRVSFLMVLITTYRDIYSNSHILPIRKTFSPHYKWLAVKLLESMFLLRTCVASWKDFHLSFSAKRIGPFLIKLSSPARAKTQETSCFLLLVVGHAIHGR